MGVHSWGLGKTFAEALRDGKCERAWVVCGREGLDEISIEGESDVRISILSHQYQLKKLMIFAYVQVWELNNSEIKHMVISPASFGLQSHPLAHVKSGTSTQNATVARYLFRPETYTQQDGVPKGPLESPLTFTTGTPSTSYTIPAGVHLDALSDFVLLQTAALLYIGGRANSLKGAVHLAKKSLRLGGAQTALNVVRSEANRAGAMLERQQKEKEERELRRIHNKDDLYYSKDLRKSSPNTDLESDTDLPGKR